jgi:hypothetical protein
MNLTQFVGGLTLGLFLLSGSAKIQDWSLWVDSLRELIPKRFQTFVVPVALATIVAELTTVIGLFVSIRRGLWGASALLLIFAGVMGALVPTHAGKPCACFGEASDSKIGWESVLRNLALAAGTAAAAAEAPSESGLSSAAAVIGLATVLIGYLVGSLRKVIRLGRLA